MRVYLWPQKYNKGYFRLQAELAVVVSEFGEKLTLLLGHTKDRSLKASLVRPPSWTSACKVIAGRPLLIWLQENGWPKADIEVVVHSQNTLWLRRRQRGRVGAKSIRTVNQKEYDERNQAAGVLPDAYVPGSRLRKITKNIQHK